MAGYLSIKENILNAACFPSIIRSMAGVNWLRFMAGNNNPYRMVIKAPGLQVSPPLRFVGHRDVPSTHYDPYHIVNVKLKSKKAKDNPEPSPE